MRKILFTSFLLISNLCFSQNKSFWVEQLGLPLKEVVSNIEQQKQLKPIYSFDYGIVEYSKVPFAGRKAHSLVLSAFNDSVYRIDLSFFPESGGEIEAVGLFAEIALELLEVYKNPQITDPDLKYGLGTDYRWIEHWDLGEYIVKLSLQDDSNLVSLRYTHTRLFDSFIKDLLEKRKSEREELLKDY